jgi:two-component system chemotaxis response regulator CheB
VTTPAARLFSAASGTAPRSCGVHLADSRFEMEAVARKDIVVVGASAGGVEALGRFAEGLRRDLPAAVFVVLHVPPGGPSMLAEILQRHTELPVVTPEDGSVIAPGRIYVASPNRHLIIDEHRVRNSSGPKENRARPSVDALFRSAAYTFGPRVIGVVLTGALDDGTAGSWTIKDRGGTMVVQDPTDAAYPSMPESALRYVPADHVLRLADIPPLLNRLTEELAISSPREIDETLRVEQAIAVASKSGLELGVMDLGTPTALTCPECHGTMAQMDGGGVPRFRCHTGHAFSLGTLLSEVTTGVETSAWNTIRAIEESVILLGHAARHLRAAGDLESAALLEQKAIEAQHRAKRVRDVVNDHEVLGTEHLGRAPTPGPVDSESS